MLKFGIEKKEIHVKNLSVPMLKLMYLKLTLKSVKMNKMEILK